MAERLIELFIPADSEQRIRELVDEMGGIRLARSEDDGTVAMRLLVDSDESEALIDRIQGRLKLAKAHRIVVLPVQASLPARPEPTPEEEEESEANGKARKTIGRVSRDELRRTLLEMVAVTRNFVLMTILATIVAAVGLERSSPAIVIGAMVIAPLLGPNMTLALATTLSDRSLAFKALRANIVGLAIAIGLSVAFAIAGQPDVSTPEILSRTQVELGDIALALASGVAGAMALSSGVAGSLVGVMVAVALLPPTVVFGLMIGTGNFELSMGAALLLATNVVCVNLAGVATFVSQGVAPQSWVDAERSKSATKWAMIVWTVILLVLAGLIVLAQSLQPGGL